MIYCVGIEQYPLEGEFIEELSYKDENDFEWKIARIEDGLMIRYFGDEYFKDNTFECTLSTGECIRVNNTNCVFIKNVEFETFCEVRNILMLGYTDEIWEAFEELLTERFEFDRTLLESEVIS